MITKSSSHSLKQEVIRRSPHILFTILLLFILAGTIAGEVFDAYRTLWWWDDALHGISGALIALLGLFIFHALHPAAARVSLIALFCFAISLAAAGIWEIFEFGVDFFFHTAMQQWNMSSLAIVMGASHQGAGLRDTMSDMILAAIGALITSLFITFAYRTHPALTRRILRHTSSRQRRRL